MAASPATSFTSNPLAKKTHLPSSLRSLPLPATVELATKIREITGRLVKACSLCGIAITPELEEPHPSTNVADGPSEWKKVLGPNLANILGAVIGNHEDILRVLKATLTLINGKKQGDELHDVWTNLVRCQSLIEILKELNKGLSWLYESFSHNSSDFNVPHAALTGPDTTQTPIPVTRKLIENCGTAIWECVTVSRMMQIVLKWDEAYPGETWAPDAVTLLERDLTQCLSAHVTTPL